MNVAILLFYFLLVFSQVTGLSFIEEYIDFEISGRKFFVNGIYVIRNESGQSIREQLFYPFPVNSGLIDSVFITDNRVGELRYSILSRGVSFEVELMPKETVLLNIGYQQKVVSDTVVYILTTTQIWENPLKKAVYSLKTDNYISIKDFSYLPDTVISEFSNKIYRWKKSNFLPEKDFVIVFN